MRSYRLLASLLALTLLGAVACNEKETATPRPRPVPTGPEVYVAARDGALVRFELDGTAAGPVTELLPDKESQWYVPLQGGAGRATVTRFTEGGLESITHSVGVVDATTGKVVSGLGPDAPAAGLLLSPDGRYRYELLSPDSGIVTHIDRVATDGGARTALIPEPRAPDHPMVASAALSPDDATLYVVLVPEEGPTSLVAIDTGSGRTRTLSPDIREDEVHSVAVSPDGRTLALTVGDPDDAPDSASDSRKTRVVLVPVGGGAPRWVDTPDAGAATFTRSGNVLLVLGPQHSPALALADPATGAVTPVVGARGVEQPVLVD